MNAASWRSDTELHFISGKTSVGLDSVWFMNKRKYKTKQNVIRVNIFAFTHVFIDHEIYTWDSALKVIRVRLRFVKIYITLVGKNQIAPYVMVEIVDNYSLKIYSIFHKLLIISILILKGVRNIPVNKIWFNKNADYVILFSSFAQTQL